MGSTSRGKTLVTYAKSTGCYASKRHRLDLSTTSTTKPDGPTSFFGCPASSDFLLD